MYSSRVPVLYGGATDCIALCLSDLGPNGRSCETYGIIVAKDTVPVLEHWCWYKLRALVLVLVQWTRRTLSE